MKVDDLLEDIREAQRQGNFTHYEHNWISGFEKKVIAIKSDHEAAIKEAVEKAVKEEKEHTQTTLFRMKSCYDEDCKKLKQHIAELEGENKVLTATVERMREALEKALPRMAHRLECVSILPSVTWCKTGSMSLDNCVCEIKIVQAALGEKEASHDK